MVKGKTFRQEVDEIQCEQRCSPHKIANCIYREAGKCCPDIQSLVDRICAAAERMANQLCDDCMGRHKNKP